MMYQPVGFLSTLSLRRATGRSWRKQSNHHKFLSTLSLRRATLEQSASYNAYLISIHALLAESDSSTPAVRSQFIHFYPRSPCGERLFLYCNYPFKLFISIHALLAESDEPLKALYMILSLFLSTLSLRRATPRSGTFRSAHNFYPRSPCGERLVGDVWACRWPDISIHALLAESDQELFRIVKPSYNFYPRSPCGERRYRPTPKPVIFSISIHALLAESDKLSKCCFC